MDMKMDMSQQSSNMSSTKLFVGQLPPNCTEDELRRLFEPYGMITELLILKDKMTGNPKGCAFVSFSTMEECDKAIANLDTKVKLEGSKKDMCVRYAGKRGPEEQKQQDWKLYVGMLSRNTTDESLSKLFEPYGLIKEIHLMRHENGISKGCAFVKYGTREEAARAILALNGIYKDADAPGLLQVRFSHTKDEKARLHNGVVPIFNNAGALFQSQPNMNMMGPFGGANHSFGANGLSGGLGGLGGSLAGGLGGGMSAGGNQFSSPYNTSMNQMQQYSQLGYQQAQQVGHQQQQPKEARGPQGANLFVYGIPEQYGDQDLASLFSNFGSVISASVQKDKATGISKGFGFVSYMDAKSAAAAVQAMDGFIMGTKRLSVRLKKGDDGQGSNMGGLTVGGNGNMGLQQTSTFRYAPY